MEVSETLKIKGGAPYATRIRSSGQRDVWEDTNDNGVFDPENGDLLILL